MQMVDYGMAAVADALSSPFSGSTNETTDWDMNPDQAVLDNAGRVTSESDPNRWGGG